MLCIKLIECLIQKYAISTNMWTFGLICLILIELQRSFMLKFKTEKQE
jgi:hypothetical protein